MNFLTINPKNLKKIDGEFLTLSDMDEKIFENGSHSDENQWMLFKNDSGDIELFITWEVNTYGNVSYSAGDYWTPSSYDIEDSDFEIDIKQVTVNEEFDVELSEQLRKIFTDLIINNLND